MFFFCFFVMEYSKMNAKGFPAREVSLKAFYFIGIRSTCVGVACRCGGCLEKIKI